ncbi:NAD(P)-dependent oxidoreductase [Pseudomonas fragi]|jgi:dTDP-4-dehydrorhamnose reductase|uniref:dTDP-4-dehydrorhamnose reductase family protein n=1 Tax=Pseudomonas fragi TaxID=296 RepID=UPI000BA1ED50|nr:SDR family oxidoreductase [Pseudomonas fragi]PAA29749.1 NAD(P)-dependent oxidoreductase [Pseudomonas fragi]
MKVLLLGASGMLGSMLYKQLVLDDRYDVAGTVRGSAISEYFSEQEQSTLIPGIDVLDFDSLLSLLNTVRPDVVINCVGLIKQVSTANDPLKVLPVNAMLPHRLCKLCELTGARLIHISTDCVFSGSTGGYTEASISDSADLYGKSKFIGEVIDSTSAITLRTSIIGHELSTNKSLIDWFLSQHGRVNGYSHAVFSGLPTIELSRVIMDHVLPRPELHGLYHVSSEPINKEALLRLVARQYEKSIEIIPDDSLVIDRSLRSDKFKHATGYTAPGWDVLVKQMFENKQY